MPGVKWGPQVFGGGMQFLQNLMLCSECAQVFCELSWVCILDVHGV